MNYVVKTTEFAERPRGGRGNWVFWGFTKRKLRCKNNGIRGETARRARKRGVFEIHKTNYVVKTTELGRKPRGRCGNWVFSGIAKRITLLKQRNSRRNRAAGAVSKWKAVRAAARCQKSVRKTQIGRARRHYPHGGEVTRQVRMNYSHRLIS